MLINQHLFSPFSTHVEVTLKPLLVLTILTALLHICGGIDQQIINDLLVLFTLNLTSGLTIYQFFCFLFSLGWRSHQLSLLHPLLLVFLAALLKKKQIVYHLYSLFFSDLNSVKYISIHGFLLFKFKYLILISVKLIKRHHINSLYYY